MPECHYLRHIVVFNAGVLGVPDVQLSVNESQEETHVQLRFQLDVSDEWRCAGAGFPFPHSGLARR